MKKTKLNILILIVLVMVLASSSFLIFKMNEGSNKFDNKFNTETYTFKRYDNEMKYSITYYKVSNDKYGFVEDYDGQEQIVDCSKPDEYTVCSVYQDQVEEEFKKVYDIVTKLEYKEDGMQYVASSTNKEYGDFNVTVSESGKLLKFESDNIMYEIDLRDSIKIPKEK